MSRAILSVGVLVLVMISLSCNRMGQAATKESGAKEQVKLITLDPGHFHAALVQKIMYPQVSGTVYVYAPAGPELEDHLKTIKGFNEREDNPTSWKEIVYTGEDFLEKMLSEKRGNVVVISGNNKKKAQYIKACVEAGLNVLADKPMCIDAEGFELLKEAFATAQSKGVLIYDIMTERSEITTILQKELMQEEGVFGGLVKGTVEEPAIVKESVHHFFKYVAGNPIKRPAWYFDTTQQGEGIVDVTTHLVDLVFWQGFPEESIDYESEVQIERAARWPTMISLEEFKKATGVEEFPAFLQDKVNGKGEVATYANGEIDYTVRGVHARVRVIWNFEAPPGAADRHYSIVRGSRSNLIIRQGKEQGWRTELYVEPAAGVSNEAMGESLKAAVVELSEKYPGVALKDCGESWQVIIPEKYRLGHEAHFGDVMQRYLRYVSDGELPAWEVANMKAKYYTTTKALAVAETMVSEPGKGMEVAKGQDRIDIKFDGRAMGSYLYGADLTKPIVYPLYSPSGIMVNRGYPLTKVEGESTDHPHHAGLFFTYDRVNGTGFWNNTNSPPQIRQKEVSSEIIAGDKALIRGTMEWVDANGSVLLSEKRKMVFSAQQDAYLIDFDMELTAQARRVVFEDTKEGMFAIRAADWLREKGGTGTYLSSNGEKTEANVWGKRAKWMRLEGRSDGKVVGIAILNHPSSVNYPTYWHARGYGLFAANPLGQGAFEEGRKVERPESLNLALEPGRSARFRFLVVIYEQGRTADQIEQWFTDYARD